MILNQSARNHEAVLARKVPQEVAIQVFHQGAFQEYPSKGRAKSFQTA